MSTTPQKRATQHTPFSPRPKAQTPRTPKTPGAASPTKRGARTAGPGRFSRAGVQLTKAGTAFGDAFKALGQAVGALVTAPPASSAKAQFHTVVIGSENPVKVDAVTAVVADYPEVIRPGTVLESVTVPSGVPAQPVGLAVVVSGARRRARNAHEAAGGGSRTLAFGIESGLIEVPRESTEHKLARYFDVCVVALYDGGHMTLGLSCAFQIPPAIAAKVMGDEAMDLSEATVAAGYSKDGAIGSKGGLIGALTRGRVTRRDYTIQAIRMALTEREPRASRGLPAASLRNTVADTEA